MIYNVAIAFALNLCAASAAAPRRLWGGDGHMITGQVAWNLLSADEQAWTRNILGGEDLAQVSPWADKAKNQHIYRWSRSLHFINVPKGQCTFDWEQDCQLHGVANWCVAGAILNYTQILLGSTSTEVRQSDDPCAGLHKEECLNRPDQCDWHYNGQWWTSCRSYQHHAFLERKDEALRFLTHFMEDLHQPLHAAWTSDAGGNDVKIQEGFDEDKNMSLHYAWDTGIIRKVETDQGYDWHGYAGNLSSSLPNASMLQDSASCLQTSSPDVKECLTQYARESVQFSCKEAYRDENGQLIESGKELDKDYFRSRSELINQRLVQGGVRLAALIKYIMHSQKIVIV